MAALISACANVVPAGVNNIAAPQDKLTGQNIDTRTKVTKTSGMFSGQETAGSTQSIKINAQPYSLGFNSRYAALVIGCRTDKVIDVNLRESWLPENGDLLTRHTGVVLPHRNRGKFWDFSSVYFDEVATSIPSSIRTLAKQVHVGDGEYETRSERILTDPADTIYTIILPKLKTSKTMRVESISSPGFDGFNLVFELGNIEGEIETLEAQCVRDKSRK